MTPKFVPREVFETLLEWSVLPTFDLVIVVRDKGVLVVKRRIVPYKDQWALPGLRMYKGESIDDTLCRIAKDELGLKIDATKKILLGQYVGKFKTEFERQDLSTGYVIELEHQPEIILNTDHFYNYKYTRSSLNDMGAMYAYYLKLWAER
jgi:8-oxo-dGTP pyrophosphatase MutT (NUDIX family)